MFPFGVGTITPAVCFSMRPADPLPERSFFVREALLVKRNRPTIRKPLKTRALCGGKPSHHILAAGLLHCDELALIAVARAGAFIIRSIQRTGLIAAVGDNVGIVCDAVLMIAGNGGADVAFAIPSGVGAERINHQLIDIDILIVGAAPISCAECANRVLIAYGMPVNGIGGAGYVGLPAAAVAFCRTCAADAISLPVCQIRLLLYTGVCSDCASLIAKITNFNPLILGKADQMARS